MDTKLLEWMKKEWVIDTMLDIGCGPGGMIDFAATIGIDAIGIDGDPTLSHPRILTHDFTTGICQRLHSHFNLAWSVEFVEHVEETYVGNFLAAFALCKISFITHAVPGQGGWHHVNCKDDRYWIETFQSAGFSYHEEWTRLARASATPGVYTALTGLVFVK